MSVRRRLDKDPDSGEVFRERWMIDFVHRQPDGKRIRIREFPPCDTKLDAMKWEQQIRKALADGTYRRGAKEEAPAVQTVAKFSERFLEWSHVHNKPSSLAAKRMVLRVHLLPVFGSTRLDAVDLAQIESFKAAQLRKGLERKTVKNQLTVLGKLLNLAAELGVVKTVPRVKGLRIDSKEIEFLDFEEADRVIAVAGPWRPFVVTGLRTGLRVGELLALRWEDVDLKAARINVRRSLWRDQEGSPKGGRHRQVPLGDQVLAVLEAHRHLRGAYVFCREDGTRLTHSEVKRVVPNACRRAGLAKRLTTHGLRHTFASHLVMRGVPLKAVQELLGHATIDMALRYAHLSPNVSREAVRLLDGAPGMAPVWHRGAPAEKSPGDTGA